VVGHVAFSAAVVGDVEEGCFVLAPLAVLPDWQHRGIGTALVEEGLDELRARHATCCVVVGDPVFYGRFGFRALPGLSYEGVAAEHVQCLPFEGPAPVGPIRAHEAFLAGVDADETPRQPLSG
jgi:putative acetyltransferase